MAAGSQFGRYAVIISFVYVVVRCVSLSHLSSSMALPAQALTRDRCSGGDSLSGCCWAWRLGVYKSLSKETMQSLSLPSLLRDSGAPSTTVWPREQQSRSSLLQAPSPSCAET